MISTYHYQETLQKEFLAKKNINSRLSQRAFAAKLGLSPSSLNEILRGHHGLSERKAQELAETLNLEGNERDLFLLDIIAKHSRSPKKQQEAKAKVREILARKSLSLQFEDVISDPMHYTLLESLYLENGPKSQAELIKYLGLEEELVSTFINNLKLAGLLRENRKGELSSVEEFTNGPDQVSSKKVRQYHQNILKRGMDAVENQELNDRDFASVILSIDKKKIPRAKELIRNFISDFTNEMGDSSHSKDAVYEIGVHFFDMLK